jgi:competence protein ComEC
VSGPAPRAAARWTWVDLRLVPVAAAVWAGCLLVPYASAGWLLGGAAVVAAVAAGIVLTGRRRAAAAVLLGVLAALAVTAVMGAVRATARETSPLRAVADSGGMVAVDIHLDAAPHRLSGPGARYIADASVSRLESGERVYRLSAPVLLFASGVEWDRLRPGEEVRTRVGVAMPRPGDDVVAVVAARSPPTRVASAGGVQRAAGTLRDGLAASAARVLDDRSAGLLPGLVVGDTRGLDPLLDDAFRRAGLTHLTAVSGANVAIVLGGILWPLRRRAADRRV